MIVIRNRHTDEIILEMERDTLKGANLRFEDLRYADLRGADLSDADLQGANLYEANLRQANLYEANLSQADLSDADLYGADLIDANIVRADLRGANLRGANLTRADLRNADISRTLGIYTIQLERDLIIAHASQIQIGCEKHSIVYWLEYYKEIGEKHEYTAKQIEIYGKQLDVIELMLAE